VVGGRTWRPAYGRKNVPDGEVYTSPVESGINGTIRFGFPAVFGGRDVDDALLRLEEGRVVAAAAADGRGDLRSVLEPDHGAGRAAPAGAVPQGARGRCSAAAARLAGGSEREPAQAWQRRAAGLGQPGALRRHRDRRRSDRAGGAR